MPAVVGPIDRGGGVLGSLTAVTQVLNWDDASRAFFQAAEKAVGHAW